jgi:hypothetical protein
LADFFPLVAFSFVRRNVHTKTSDSTISVSGDLPGDFEIIEKPQPGAFYRKKTSRYLDFRGISVYSHFLDGRKKIHFDPARWPAYNVVVDTFARYKHYELIAIIGVLAHIKDSEEHEKSD